MPVASQPRSATGGVHAPPAEIAILWLTAGLSCDGDTIAMTAATQPSIEDLAERRAFPGLPKVKLHNPFLASEVGDEFLRLLPSRRRAANSDPFILVVEGSIPDETNKAEGYWAAFGTDPPPASRSRPATGSTAWRRKPGRSSPPAPARPTAGSTPWPATPPARWACPITSAGTGGRRAGIPIVCIAGLPGAARQHDRDAPLPAPPVSSGRAPTIPLDEVAPADAGSSSGPSTRDATAAATTSRREFAEAYGSPLCIVKLGCWGPVVQCNVGKRGWMGGIGGCPNVGGICIGCTMPGFPDKFMPFMDQPPGSLLSSTAVMTYGRAIQALRRFTMASMNKEPSWRRGRRDTK